MRIAHKRFVMVADGRKALFFRNEGDGLTPSLIVERKAGQDNPPQREQGTDTPGRAATSAGSACSAFSETDFHQLEEDRFAGDIADMRNARALKDDYAELIVVAPPKTPGEMRKHYHKEVSRRLTGELAKDLTSHPVAEIEKLLTAAEEGTGTAHPVPVRCRFTEVSDKITWRSCGTLQIGPGRENSS